MPGPESVLSAASELRAAVHALALTAVTVEPAAESLRRSAQLVRSAALDRGPDLAAEPDALRHYRHRSLFQGPLHPFSPDLVWRDVDRPDGAPTRGFGVTLSRLYQGPPGAVHGGYISGLFDELLGAVQALVDGGGRYTARLTVRYRSITPIEVPLEFTGWITRQRGRRVSTVATCHTAAGQLTADAEALFVHPGRTK